MVKVDWVTLVASESDVCDFASSGLPAGLVVRAWSVVERSGGWRGGFRQSADVVNGVGMVVGHCAWDQAGDGQWLGMVELTGSAFAADPVGIARDVHAWALRVGARITRLDAALDIIGDGQDWGDWAISQWESGGFSPLRGSRPSMRDITERGRRDGHDGRTVYVGRRGSAAMCRTYDKRAEQRLSARSSWWRVEVELRPVDRVLPLSWLVEPAEGFAYFRCLADLLATTKTVWKARKRAAKELVGAAIERAHTHARQQAGRWVRFALNVGQSAAEIIGGLVVDRPPPSQIWSTSVLTC